MSKLTDDLWKLSDELATKRQIGAKGIIEIYNIMKEAAELIKWQSATIERLESRNDELLIASNMKRRIGA